MLKDVSLKRQRNHHLISTANLLLRFSKFMSVQSVRHKNIIFLQGENWLKEIFLFSFRQQYSIFCVNIYETPVIV